LKLQNSNKDNNRQEYTKEISSVGRAIALQAICQGFESFISYYFVQFMSGHTIYHRSSNSISASYFVDGVGHRSVGRLTDDEEEKE
jgi:hypothetical protein